MSENPRSAARFGGVGGRARQTADPNFSAGGIATPADAALVMHLGAEAVFVGSGIFKSDDPAARAKAIVMADDVLQRSAEASRSKRRSRHGDAGPRYFEAAAGRVDVLGCWVLERHQGHENTNLCAFVFIAANRIL